MRKIRFRGKRTDGKGWAFGDLAHEAFDGTSKILPIAIRQKVKGYYSYPIEVIPETVGQFIGENDKNGVEIYEGDLLKYPGYAIYLEVVFSQKEYRFKLAPNCGIVPYLHDKDLEIIGNIIDNPELLKS